jgi:hypothetical protein
MTVHHEVVGVEAVAVADADADADQVKHNSLPVPAVAGIPRTHPEWPLEPVDVELAVAVMRYRSNLVVAVAAEDSLGMVRLVTEGKRHTVVEAVRMGL